MQTLKIKRKNPTLDDSEVMDLVNQFNSLTTENATSLSKPEVSKAFTAHNFTYDEVREAMKNIGDASGRVDVEEFAELYAKLKDGAGGNVAQAKAGKVKLGGSTASSAHTVNEDERTEFTRHINMVLEGDKDVGSRIPIPTDTMQIFDECKDGLILSKLINDSVADTIDERVLNKPASSSLKTTTPGHKRGPSLGGKATGLNNFQMTENNNIVIASAKGIGCSVVNIGPTDLSNGTEHLILGLIWQIIRRGLLSKIDIKLHPELYRLLEDDETLEQFLRLPPDQILLRWFNYHLKAAGHQRRVANFGKDVADGENYTILLHQLKPAECSKGPLQERELLKRAEQVLQNADRIGCRKYLTPTAMVAGNPKLNLAFVANLFNTWPGLEALEESEKPVIEDFDAEGEREARVFTLWLNSLNVEPAVYDLFENLKDGTILLQAFDKVIPGTVAWRRVSKRKPQTDPDEPAPELSRFKAVENTNYSVELAKANHMSMVGIQGADIVDGSKTLTLGLVWQLMRKNVVATLASLSKNGKEVSDTDIVKWANEKVKSAGKKSSMRSFKDPAIKDAVFWLDLLDAMKPGYVDYDLIQSGNTEEGCKNNARLAISIARKIGTTIFVVPEDLVELRTKLIMTFAGALMAIQN